MGDSHREPTHRPLASAREPRAEPHGPSARLVPCMRASCLSGGVHAHSRTRALAAIVHLHVPHCALRVPCTDPHVMGGAIGPSHMGRLPGSCLACARLAGKAACMRIRRSMRAQPWLSCQATGRNRHAGSPSTSVSRVTQQPRRGGDFSSLAHHSRRRRSIEAAFSSLVQSSSCSFFFD